jgi:hypothetical protein
VTNTTSFKQRLLPWLFAGLLSAVWAAVATGSHKDPIGPHEPLSPKFEQRAVKASARALRCMQAAAEDAPNLNLDASPSIDVTYLVGYPASPLVSDGINLTFNVTTPDRNAYLVREGGFAGLSSAVGPVQVGPCIRRAMLDAQANDLVGAQDAGPDALDLFR